MSRSLFLCCLAFVLSTCGSTGSSDTSSGVADGIDDAIKVDHFGYRPGDSKIAVITQDPGASVEVRKSNDGSLVLAVPPVSKGWDAQAGDNVWIADFSSLTAPGSYYVQVPGKGRSYDFDVSADVYHALIKTVLKAMYAQRCGTAHPAQYMGAAWADPSACHPQDAACTRHPSQAAGTDFGALNLSGGWHDAGDYNKYIGQAGILMGDAGDAIWHMATAYDLNTTFFTDGQFNIPESANGVPDILDEIRWGLNWYLKMQRPDGSLLRSVYAKFDDFGTASPPSADTTVRYYLDANVDSTALATACFAIGMRLFAAIDPTYSAALSTAVTNAWTWLSGKSAESKVWAAAEIVRAGHPAAAAARSYVDGFTVWSNAYGMWPDGCNFNDISYGAYMVRALVAYPQASGASASAVAGMKKQFEYLVHRSIAIAGPYGSGMDPDLVAGEYLWDSNRFKALRGMLLIVAAKIGATASHTAAETRRQATEYLHYLSGVNALNMVYVTNVASIGGEHCVWRIYHAWFPYGNSKYYGKPAGVDEPKYPYFAGTDALGIGDNVSSTYGPFPGLVPDGPNQQYGGIVAPPKGAAAPHRFYRDWAYTDPAGDKSKPWEVNETGIYYITAFAALASQFTETSP